MASTGLMLWMDLRPLRVQINAHIMFGKSSAVCPVNHAPFVVFCLSNSLSCLATNGFHDGCLISKSRKAIAILHALPINLPVPPSFIILAMLEASPGCFLFPDLKCDNPRGRSQGVPDLCGVQFGIAWEPLRCEGLPDVAFRVLGSHQIDAFREAASFHRKRCGTSVAARGPCQLENQTDCSPGSVHGLLRVHCLCLEPMSFGRRHCGRKRAASK